MLWEYKLARQALVKVYGQATNQLIRKFPSKEQKRIFDALEEMKADPFLGDIVKLGGEDNIWRRRIGNYRIKYRVFTDKKIIDIYDIDRRTSSTY